ncbi:hypothetical protein [Tenacibaculum sp. M341]|uniref:hypothetical protein n=1 Tax=Tenacibaculum sp. M341 TaxID=2530339 RepID=UPI001043FE73|nr:hypothetical protein [Tenacibaculum sp. M341]TCI92187.1 hypothetical protein EYW44_08380 [Tenacibaculum sp. M341]
MNTLQKALTTNTLFSGFSGIILILCNHQIADLFGITNTIVFLIIGLVLIYFSLTIWYEIKKQRKLAVLWIIVQDYAWVLGSIILLIFNPFHVTQTGNIIIGIIAFIVLLLGITQMIALQKRS